MAAYTAFLERLRPLVKGCPDFTLERELRQAAITFCRKTLVWRSWHDDIDVEADTPEYALTVPVGQEPEIILEAWLVQEGADTGIPLEPLSLSELNTRLGDWKRQQGEPRYVTHPLNNATVRLAPIPTTSVTDGLRLLVAWVPTEDSTVVDDEIYRRHYQALVDGALAELLSHPEPWRDLRMQEQRSRAFERAIGAARWGTERNWSRNSRRVEPREPLIP